MKSIIIVRHGKSSWSDFSIGDFDRPLADRGVRDAPRMAQFLENKKIIPTLLICSSAKRTKETAMFFAKELGISSDQIHFEKNLYMGIESDYTDVMFGVDDDVDTIMMFGHNPGITYIANICSKEIIENVPTTGVIIIDMDIEKWVDADWDKATLKAFYYPKMI